MTSVGLQKYFGHHGTCKGYVCNPLVAGSIVGVPCTLNTWSECAKFWSRTLNTGAETIVDTLKAARQSRDYPHRTDDILEHLLD